MSAVLISGITEHVACQSSDFNSAHVPQFNGWTEQKPMCASLSERHTAAACVYHAGIANHAVTLHVRVAANSQWHF
jgi:hypothetical protein